MMNTNNILRQNAATTLEAFQILPNADGSWPDPFHWPHTNFCTDRGPDMVCEDHAYSYKFLLNTNRNWDLSHSTSASGKAALESCGLYRHEVVMMSVQNIMYGSMLSHPRIEQIYSHGHLRVDVWIWS